LSIAEGLAKDVIETEIAEMTEIDEEMITKADREEAFHLFEPNIELLWTIFHQAPTGEILRICAEMFAESLQLLQMCFVMDTELSSLRLVMR